MAPDAARHALPSWVRAAGLTPRQAELLHLCVVRGYYDIPRRATLRELAREAGISTTSLSLALRRAESRIVTAHILHDVAGAAAREGRGTSLADATMLAGRTRGL